MGVNNSKLECIWLPGQSGKTRNVMERIKTLEEAAEVDYSCDGFFNVVISANNRGLVDQTEVRMNKELFVDDEENEQADSKIEGTCFKWRSGLKNNNVSAGELADLIKEGDVTMVVCCAHAKRLSYLFDLLTNLNKSRHFTKKINIWIDEADVSINLWSKPSVDVTGFPKVNKVTLVSATYDSIIKKYGKIRVLPCLETTLPIYHRVQDCIVIEQDIMASSAPEYLAEVVDQFKSELIKPGVRLFAPGDVERASHDAIADFLASKGFAVVIINGLRKEILIPGREKPVSLTPYIDDSGAPEEVGRVIAKIYHDNNLARFPVAITGHLCLGRGITFQNDQFLFTHGIIFDISDKANAYQTACRLAGNIKGLPSYYPPTLITTTKMKKIIFQKENTAINIARHVSDHDLTHVDKVMIECLYGSGKRPAREEDFIPDHKGPFASFEEAQSAGFGADFKKKLCDTEEPGRKKGFYYSSISGSATILSYDDVLRAMNGKVTSNMPTDIPIGVPRYRYYIGYKNKDDASTAVFFIRGIIRVNESDY